MPHKNVIISHCSLFGETALSLIWCSSIVLKRRSMSHTFYTRYFRLDTTLALVAMKVWFVLPFVATLEHNCSNVTFACCSSCVWDCVATRHVTFDNFDQVFRCLYGRCLGCHIHLHCHWRIYRALFAATRRENAVSACRCSILQQKDLSRGSSCLTQPHIESSK